MMMMLLQEMLLVLPLVLLRLLVPTSLFLQAPTCKKLKTQSLGVAAASALCFTPDSRRLLLATRTGELPIPPPPLPAAVARAARRITNTIDMLRPGLVDPSSENLCCDLEAADPPPLRPHGRY